jgi:hypothetical protein
VFDALAGAAAIPAGEEPAQRPTPEINLSRDTAGYPLVTQGSLNCRFA